MKKLILYMLCLTAIITTTGCGAKKQNEVSGNLEDLVNKIYAESGLEMPMTEIVPLTADNVEYELGTAEVNFTEGVASSPLINTIPHSLVLFRVDETTDIEKTKQLVKESADPRKWICVGVDESDVVVDNIGNLIVLIMDENSDKLHESFLKLAQ